MQPRLLHPAAGVLCNLTYENFNEVEAQKLIDIYFYYSDDDKYVAKKHFFSAYSKCCYAKPAIYELIVELLAECTILLFNHQQPKAAEKFASYLIKLIIDTENAVGVETSLNRTFIALATHLTDQNYRLFTQQFVLQAVSLPNAAAKDIWNAICLSLTGLNRQLSAEDKRHLAIYENHLAGIYSIKPARKHNNSSFKTPLCLFYCENGLAVDEVHNEIKNHPLYTHYTSKREV